MTRSDTFEQLSHWIEEVRSHGSEKITIFLVGNKADEQAKRVISWDTSKEFADRNNIVYMETSAKTEQGIEELFQLVSNVVLAKIADGIYDGKFEESGIKIGELN